MIPKLLTRQVDVPQLPTRFCHNVLALDDPGVNLRLQDMLLSASEGSLISLPTCGKQSVILPSLLLQQRWTFPGHSTGGFMIEVWFRASEALLPAIHQWDILLQS